LCAQRRGATGFNERSATAKLGRRLSALASEEFDEVRELREAELLGDFSGAQARTRSDGGSPCWVFLEIRGSKSWTSRELV